MSRNESYKYVANSKEGVQYSVLVGFSTETVWKFDTGDIWSWKYSR